MRFLEVFNEIVKGNYALTDEAVYSSLQNGDELIPLYGGNKTHTASDRRISISAQTKKGIPVTVFSGEGIIISLDGSAGAMTYKSNERFALNHHAGFFTIRDESQGVVNLEYFAIFMQDFYKSLSVSDGSKTLSLAQIYTEELDLPDYSTQCRILMSIQAANEKIQMLASQKNKYQSLKTKEFSCDYEEYQATDVPISICVDYMSGNTGLTEEFIYQTLQSTEERYPVLSSATEESTMMGTVPNCIIHEKPIKMFCNKSGLLVTRNGKAGHTRFLPKGSYTINDHAYILFLKDTSPYNIDFRWLAIQYRQQFLQYSSNADNGTWNMTGFFQYTRIDIPSISEQLQVVAKFEEIDKRVHQIELIENRYSALLAKKIACYE